MVVTQNTEDKEIPIFLLWNVLFFVQWRITFALNLLPLSNIWI